MCLHVVSLYLGIKTIKGNLILNNGDCTAQHHAASSSFRRIIFQTLTRMITNTLCCHGAFRCRRKHFPLSFMRLQWLPLYPRHPPFHDEAGLSLLSVLLLHFCLTSLKVNLFSSLRSLSTSRIIFCVSWQFCVCRVMSVCFGIGAAIEHIRDIYIILRSISSEYFDSLSCMCLCFFSFFNQLLTSCLHPRWIRQSTNSCPTLQPPCIHQREVRLHIQVFILKPSTC